MHKNYQREVLQHVNAVTGSVPAHRLASKQFYSFSGTSFEEQLVVWDYIWCHTENFWVRVHAFFFLERNMKNPVSLKQMWPVVVNWQDHVNDWGLCDALAKIYTKILEILPGEVYAELKKWNRDKDLWRRRQSVVSLLYYSGTKKVFLPFDKINRLINPLIKDKEYYVQKGVGWALRELYAVYPKNTLPYLIRCIKSISSIAFTIAIEKMETIKKNKLKSLRKR